MDLQNSKKRWSPTGVQFLVKHSSGTYYARGYRNGKQVWQSLGTTQVSVAKARLSEWLQEYRRCATASTAASGGRMTMADVLQLHLTALDENVSIKESTRHYWRQVSSALFKSWPRLGATDVRRISATDCRSWSAKFAKRVSASRYNNTVAVLRHIFTDGGFLTHLRSRRRHQPGFYDAGCGACPLTAMYNVLKALRASRALTPKEQTVHDHGLVSVLRQLHDELDAAVAAAYGWPAVMSDAEILARLVALNAERATEEAAGRIRWLRPAYQSPAGGSTQAGLHLKTAAAPATKSKASKTKAPWPTSLAERVRAVEHVLRATSGPMTAAWLAQCFSRAKPTELTEILETLALLGRVHRDGEIFSV